MAPVSAAHAKPAMAQGPTEHAGSNDTRRKNPSRRRSKKPTTPTRRQRAAKWTISQNGHSHGSTRIASETGVSLSHVAKASSVGATGACLSDVRHVAAGHDCGKPQRQRRRDRKSVV